MATDKKVTRVKTDSSKLSEVEQERIKNYQVSPENKKKATTNRIIAAVLWVVAIAAELFAIFWVLKQDPIIFWLLIVLIVVIAILAIVGSVLWKKSNRLDPAPRSETVRFFVQNQLGAIIAVLAFLPLIILIFLNKDMDGKQKGIAGGIAIVLLLAAGVVGVDTKPPALEDYAAQSARIEQLTGQDFVYWAKTSQKYHLYDDCSAINRDATTEIFEGTVSDAFGSVKLDQDDPLCQICENRWVREHPDATQKDADTNSGESTQESGSTDNQDSKTE